MGDIEHWYDDSGDRACPPRSALALNAMIT